MPEIRWDYQKEQTHEQYLTASITLNRCVSSQLQALSLSLWRFRNYDYEQSEAVHVHCGLI